MTVERFELPTLPVRPANAHKGTFGSVGVIGGCDGDRVMLGAPVFVALAALRTGCGLATIAAPGPLLVEMLGAALEATGVALPTASDGTLEAAGCAEVIDRELARMRVLAVGPGLGQGEAQRQIVFRLVAHEERPLVIDADGLNALAGALELQRDFRARAILTPHPGEYLRLASGLGIEASLGSDSGREEAAIELARRLGAVVVLKGPATVVTDGQQLFVNDTGNQGLATAGSGDVLTGVCAGFLAQFEGQLSMLECAALAVHVHGRAAERCTEDRGDTRLLARELLDGIPAAIAEISHRE